jgi:hypothetical protein
MNALHYLAIGIRLFALTLMLKAGEGGYYLLMALFDSPDDLTDWPAAMMVAALLPLLVAVALWCFPLAISRRIVEPDIMPAEIQPPTLQSLAQILVAAVALYFMFSGVVGVAYDVVAMMSRNRPPLTNALWYMSSDMVASLASSVVELALSLLVFVKSAAIGRLMVRLGR